MESVIGFLRYSEQSLYLFIFLVNTANVLRGISFFLRVSAEVREFSLCRSSVEESQEQDSTWA